MVNTRTNPFLFHLGPWLDLQRSLGEGVINTLVEGTKPRPTRGTLYQDEEGATWVAHLPDLRMQDLELTVDGRVLTLNEGCSETADATCEENGKKPFEQVLRMPFDVDSDAAEASNKHGLLIVRLPRAKASQGKRIHITTDE